jgi:hypothetical protein
MNSKQLEEDGFVVVPDIIGSNQCDALGALIQSITTPGAGSRTFLDQRWCVELANQIRRHSELRALLPADAVAVQSTLFDKSPEKNWLVSLHQGEGGCLFDEIGNLVEPTERLATEGRTGLTSHGRRDAAPNSRRLLWVVEEGRAVVCAPSC